MGVVERCKERLEACKLLCQIRVAMVNDRNKAEILYLKCVKEVCENEYDKCLDESPLGKLLAILA